MRTNDHATRAERKSQAKVAQMVVRFSEHLHLTECCQPSSRQVEKNGLYCSCLLAFTGHFDALYSSVFGIRAGMLKSIRTPI